MKFIVAIQALMAVGALAAATPAQEVPRDKLSADWQYSGTCYTSNVYGYCKENGGSTAYSCNSNSRCLANGNGCYCQQSGCYCAGE